MRIERTIQKWGNGLAIRISGMMRDIPVFEEGTKVEVEVTEDGLTIRKIKKTKKPTLPFSESYLLNGLTAETAHSDLLAEPLNKEF